MSAIRRYHLFRGKGISVIGIEKVFAIRKCSLWGTVYSLFFYLKNYLGLSFEESAQSETDPQRIKLALNRSEPQFASVLSKIGLPKCMQNSGKESDITWPWKKISTDI